ncbi:MAG TPA: trehalose-phosphatase [Burkholderiales bacterium]|nr:trehalose-phosphatase [Burkholderiales bacterium]
MPPAATPPFTPNAAWFLDIDGTLLDIEDRPEEVRVKPRELKLLEDLRMAANGALALVSGRSIAKLDELFEPLRIPVAGQHGAERRDAAGRLHRHASPGQGIDLVLGRISRVAKRHDGLVVENKGQSVALHYRLAPQLAGVAHAAVHEAAAAAGPGIEIQGGKMVYEVKPAGCDKGKAIAAFMREAPFAGRVPIFLGDDLTDELGFRVVNRMGGHAIKVGVGTTAAPYRLADPAEARAWLREWLAHWESTRDAARR